MLANLFQIIQENDLFKEFVNLNYTLSTTKQVIDDKGNLTLPNFKNWQLTDNPKVHVNFETKQISLETRNNLTLEDSLEELNLLSDAIQTTLDDDQFIWPYALPSNLVSVNELKLAKEKPFAVINTSQVTINFSETFLTNMYEYYHDEFEDQQTFNEIFFTKIINRLNMYQWFITYVLGNSPFMPNGFKQTNTFAVRSLISILADEQKLDNFIIKYVDDVAVGITFKNLEPSGATLANLTPLDVSFLSVFTLFCATLTNEEPTNNELLSAKELNLYVANEEAIRPTLAKDGGKILIKSLSELVQTLPYDAKYYTTVKMLTEYFDNPSETCSAKLSTQAFNNSILSFGREQASNLKKEWLDENVLLPTLADLTNSQQKTVLDLIKKGDYFLLTPTHKIIYEEQTYPTTITWPKNIQ